MPTATSVPPLETALLELQRRRLALTAAFMALRTAAPHRWDRNALAILLAYLALRRSRLSAQALYDCRPGRTRAGR